MGSSITMETTCVLLLLSCLFSLQWDTTLAWSTAALTPPAGNSLQTIAKTQNGFQLYRCVDGDWLLESAYALLVDMSNNQQPIGNYSYVQQPRQPRFVGTWALLNSQGDTAESGSPMSLVEGKRIAVATGGSGNLAHFLAEASKHKFEGAASLISYIARLNTKGGLPRSHGYCDAEKLWKLPFEAEFHFWKQDLLPPSVPQVLELPIDRPIVGFFARGVVTYVFENENWQQENVAAKLYDVPGGIQVGSYYIRSIPDNKGGNYCWQVNNPNGFELVGKAACEPVTVSPGCLPWSLVDVTTYSGNTTTLGPYSHILMVSTRGGLPPASRSSKPSPGERWKEPFSAIFWLFCNF